MKQLLLLLSVIFSLGVQGTGCYNVKYFGAKAWLAVRVWQNIKLGTFLDGTYVPEKVNWVCGRIKLGTESNGGYRYIGISNCNYMWSSGLAFEEVDQGRMENIVVDNVSLSNIRIQYCGGRKEVTTPYRDQGTNYPEPRWAGPTPAYGLYARHVDGLKLHNVKFELMRPDERPDILLEDVQNADIGVE